MSLEQRLVDSIAEAARRTPAPTFDLAGIRRRARRRTMTRAVAMTAAVVVVAGLAATRLTGHDDALPPVDLPSSTPPTAPSPSAGATVAPTVIPDVRDEQVEVTWDQPPSPPSVPKLLGRRTSDDPDYAGDGEVSVSGPVHGYMQVDAFGWERSCTGAPGTWWVFTVQPDISFQAVGRCDGSGQPTSAPPPGSLDGPMIGIPGDVSRRTTEVEVRMFLTDQDPTEYYDCIAYSPKKGCADVEPPHAVGTGARFGVALYARAPVEPATTIFGSEIYPAARVLGTTYSFTTAVAAATGSRLLTYRLPPSTHQRIVQAMAGQEEPCRHTAGHRSPDCLPAPELRIDGRLVDDSNDFLFTTLGAKAELAAGGAHEVTLEIPATDTDVLDLGFVVFEARGG